ncbi:MAG TPA: hypothetical protein VGH27_12135 [Streptosporangiaceae bacterium]
MELGKIIAGGGCGENDCPAIALAGDGMLDVQGYQQPGVETPTGEAVVRIPAALILEAARALGG